MKWVLRVLIGLAVLAALVTVAAWLVLPRLNDYLVDGELMLAGLEEPVRVVRDEKGMPYLFAQSFDDAFFAQGFVTAQDRLFQMHLTRLVAQGRLTELVGERAREVDVRRRTIGLGRIAERHAAILDDETRNLFQRYADGVNAFVEATPGDIHLEFKLAGVDPEPWTIADSLSVLYYMAWSNSANLTQEVIGQRVIEKVGPERAREIAPRNVNPDDPRTEQPVPVEQAPVELEQVAGLGAFSGLGAPMEHLANLGLPSLRLGSNNWVAAPSKTPGGTHPILAGDSHLDARILPGVWHPIGLVLPDNRAVGVTVAGLPGIAIGRTGYAALAMTNAYGDTQDLFVETVDPSDPSRYLDGGESIAFETVEETLRIKDDSADSGFREETVTVRLSHRGPVVSDVLPGLSGDRVLTLRWAPAESMTPRIGVAGLLEARSIAELDDAFRDLPMLTLNFVYADVHGDIAWRASGALPMRVEGAGTLPWRVDDGDSWTGWIPFEAMPHVVNPERGWTGTANHRTTTADVPYYYSNYFSPAFRYRRLKQVMDSSDSLTVDDHWRLQRDPVNQMAAEIAPVVARALSEDEETRELGSILADWNHRDDLELAAPALFQTIYRKLAERMFRDELGEELTRDLLGSWYFWQERLHAMLLADDSPWFDDVGTPAVVESRDDLFRQATIAAREELSELLGDDPGQWRWGAIHHLTFVNPIRTSGTGARFLGSGPHPMGGSGETLYRGLYEFGEPFGASFFAAQRMVADLGDTEKVRAVLAGGVVGRTFHRHQKDQIEPFMSGEPVYWWLSDEAIAEHARHELVLTPTGRDH